VSETNLPANLATNGGLPATYEAAKRALAECQRIDECKDWADKAAALASYARQAQDRSLLDLAQRIQLRATRRYGELLKQVPRGDEATRYGQEGAHQPVITRTQAAKDAGISPHQARQALRVASVPADEFEDELGSDRPPTVTALAARGTISRVPAPVPPPAPASPAKVADATAMLCQFAAFCGTCDPVSIASAPGVDADILRGQVATIDQWLDRFVTNLPSEQAAA
jgi:hypothetical protein